jgi:hypothetical protein
MMVRRDNKIALLNMSGRDAAPVFPRSDAEGNIENPEEDIKIPRTNPPKGQSPFETWYDILPNRVEGARRTNPRLVPSLASGLNVLDAACNDVRLSWRTSTALNEHTIWEVEKQDHSGAGTLTWADARPVFVEGLSSSVRCSVGGFNSGRMVSFRVRGVVGGVTSEWQMLNNVTTSQPKKRNDGSTSQPKKRAKGGGSGGDGGRTASRPKKARPAEAKAAAGGAQRKEAGWVGGGGAAAAVPAPREGIVRSPAAAMPAARAGGLAEVATLGQCIMCLDRPIDCVYMPCGHSQVCSGCVQELNPQESDCMICRQPVTNVLQLTLDNLNRKDSKCGHPGCSSKRDCVVMPCRCFELCAAHAAKWKACPHCKTPITGRQRVY